MIVLIIVLLSLCALYFTRLVSSKNMKVAAICIVMLYSYLIAWIYFIFIFDVVDLGFSETETRLTLLRGSDIYHSFVNLTDKMSVIPLALLEAIVAVAAVILCASFVVAFHGLFEITRAVVTVARDKEILSATESIRSRIISSFMTIKLPNIIRFNCRMNC